MRFAIPRSINLTSVSKRKSLILLFLLVLVGCGQSTPTARPTPTAPVITRTTLDITTPRLITPTPRPSSTPRPSPTKTRAPTATPTRIANPVTAQLDAYLGALQKQGRFSGNVLIARHHQIIYQNSFGYANRTTRIPFTDDTQFRIGSITKQMTAAAILKLQAQGKLNVQDPMCNYIPACPFSWTPITIHQLLTHTSGIANYDIFPDVLAWYAEPHTSQEILDRMQQVPLLFAPGYQFHYTNAGYVVLAMIVEQVSGQSYGDFLQSNFFDPLGMKHTGVQPELEQLAWGYRNSRTPFENSINPMDNSNMIGAANLYSTAPDLLLWANALDAWQNDPDSEYQPMFQPQFIGPELEPGFSYGYGLSIEPRLNQEAIGHNGSVPGFASVLMRYPQSNLTIIILSNSEDMQSNTLSTTIAKIALGVQ